MRYLRVGFIVGICCIAQVAFGITQEQRIQQEEDKANALEDAWTKALAAGGQWTGCPEWVKGIYIDPAGKPWFQADSLDGLQPDESMKRSVDRVLSGKSRVIRAEIQRVDRAGRIFVLDQRGHLLYYDPSTKQWAVRLADATTLSTDPKQVNAEHGRFERGMSWEDSTGADWFVGGDRGTGWNIHRLAADGTWTNWKVFEDQKVSEFPLARPVLVEQAGGAFVLCATYEVDNYEHKKVGALRFDGKSWSPVNPRVCAVNEHETKEIIPNHDGSISTICGGEKMWTYWPEDALKQATDKIESLINSLADPDPKIRGDARQRLALMGDGALAPMKAQLSTAPLSAQESMRTLIQDIIRTGADRKKGDHDAKLPYGGEWTYRNLSLCSRNFLGHTAVLLEDPQNLITHQTGDFGIAVIQDDGTWDVRLGSRKQWESTGWHMLPVNAFVDSKGRVWAEDAMRRIEPDMKMRSMPPAGLEISGVVGEDATGRFYMRGGRGYVVYNEAAGAAVSELEEKSFPALGPCRVKEDSEATAISPLRDSLLLLSGGDAARVSTGFQGGPIIDIIPLSHGGALLGGGDLQSDVQWMFWDGTAGVSAQDMKPLVEKNAAAIAKLAGKDFENFNNAQLAADAEGHIWFGHRYYELSRPPAKDKQTYRDQFSYFDGALWHDVPAELKKPMRPIRTVNNGHVALAASGKDLLAIHFSGGALAAQTVIANEPSINGFPEHFVDAPNGETWAYLKSHLLLIRDGAFVPQTQSAVPLLADADGRLWCVSDGKLLAKVGDAWIKMAISGVDNDTQMIETPDKRIWALHREALSLVNIDTGSGSPAIKEAGRWSWGSPRSGFSGLVCDGSNYLWYAGNENNCVRLTLPKAGASRQ